MPPWLSTGSLNRVGPRPTCGWRISWGFTVGSSRLPVWAPVCLLVRLYSQLQTLVGFESVVSLAAVPSLSLSACQ